MAGFSVFVFTFPLCCCPLNFQVFPQRRCPCLLHVAKYVSKRKGRCTDVGNGKRSLRSHSYAGLGCCAGVLCHLYDSKRNGVARMYLGFIALYWD